MPRPPPRPPPVPRRIFLHLLRVVRMSRDGRTTAVGDVRRADRHHGRRLRRDRLPARADRPQRAAAGRLRRRAAAARPARTPSPGGPLHPPPPPPAPVPPP